MTNWFRLTPDKSLDRGYLRICAVYRCMTRYGMPESEAIRRLTERGVKNRGMRATEAKALIAAWRQSASFRAAA